MASAILPREIKTWWRHVTTPPNPHERTSALPGTSKRAEVSPPLQSVRASVDGCRASPCTHARSEVAHRGWDLLSGVTTPRITQESPLLIHLLLPFLYKVCCWKRETDTLPSCLGLRRMSPRSPRAHTRWVEPKSSCGNISTWQALYEDALGVIVWFVSISFLFLFFVFSQCLYLTK